MIVLSIMPCHDKESSVDVNNSKTTISQGTNDLTSCQDESCPPLCNCSCCGTTFVINAYTQLLFYGKEVIQVNSFPSVQKPSRISYSIWQPPKIA